MVWVVVVGEKADGGGNCGPLFFSSDLIAPFGAEATLQIRLRGRRRQRV